MDANRVVRFVQVCTETPFGSMDDAVDLFDKLKAVPGRNGKRVVEGLGSVRWEEEEGQLSEIRLDSLSSEGEEERDAIKRALSEAFGDSEEIEDDDEVTDRWSVKGRFVDLQPADPEYVAIWVYDPELVDNG